MPCSLIEGKQQVGDPVAGLSIEVAGGFIGKQHARTAVKGARQRHALLLAAGKLRGQVVEAFAQPQLFQQGFGAARGFRRRFLRAARPGAPRFPARSASGSA